MIRIGTKSDELAIIQATAIAKHLDFLEHKVQIVKIKSKENHSQNELDTALLNGEIDIAIHTLKDVPTVLTTGIVQAAILKRENFNDALIFRENSNFFENKSATIATSNLNRKTQWLNRYPNHTIVDLDGDLETRLQKLDNSNWDAAIFPVAGLKKLKLFPPQEDHIKLDWMIPTPAQGVTMLATLEDNDEILTICEELNHEDTETCINIEREFLHYLEGGTNASIGALAYLKEEEVTFKSVIFSPNGDRKIEFSKTIAVESASDLGKFAAEYMIAKGAKNIMQEQIVTKKDNHVYSTKFITKAQTKSLIPTLGISMSDFIENRDLRIKPKHLKNKIKNVVFTNQHAVNSFILNYSYGELDFENIYCVSRRTKRLIERKIGTVAKVESSAEKLANYIVENVDETEFTYFCGTNKENELPAILTANNCTVTEIESYKTIYNSVKVDAKYSGILFYTLPSIESFLINNTSQDRIAFCSSETVALEAKKHFETVIVSKMETVDSVLDCANVFFSKK